MKTVEIRGKLNNNFKRYNIFYDLNPNQVLTHYHHFPILYGFNKGTDIVQTSSPTNILIDGNNNPIGTSEPVYFGIRVHPFCFQDQYVSFVNGSVEYLELTGSLSEYGWAYAESMSGFVLKPTPYTGPLYPEPTISTNEYASYDTNTGQAFQQFINDCNLPLKPNLELPTQSVSASQGSNGIPYFGTYWNGSPYIPGDTPTKILHLYISNLDFITFDINTYTTRFGLAVNDDFEEAPNIYLPYLYTPMIIPNYFYDESRNTIKFPCGLLMQAMLYDSNGKVITG